MIKRIGIFIITLMVTLLFTCSTCFADTTIESTDYDTNITFTINDIDYSTTEYNVFSLCAGLGYLKDDEIIHVAMPGDNYIQTITIINNSEKIVDFNVGTCEKNAILNKTMFEKYHKDKTKDETIDYFWSNCFMVDLSQMTDKTLCPTDTYTFTIPVKIDGVKTTNVYQLMEFNYDYTFSLSTGAAPIIEPDPDPDIDKDKMPIIKPTITKTHKTSKQNTKPTQQTTSPNTGDNAHMGVWWAVFIITGMIILYTAVYRKR